MDKAEKIAKLENKIKEMQKVYKSDVRESYREAQQTQEIIHNLNAPLQRLKVDSQNGTSLDTKNFVIKSGNQERIIRVGNSPDPANGMISSNSPIGQKLIKSKPGDSITIGEDDYIVV